MKQSVRLKGVTKRFGAIEAVKTFTFEFPPGKLTTLLGPSGCGKTTTLRCIGGFYEPDAGEIWIGDQNVTRVPPYARPTGTVFQNYALFPHLTVFGNVAYGLRVKKLSRAVIKEKVDRGLGLMRLDGLADRYPHQLSGGQQQRVAIARVLVTEPQVLLFDEPLSNLDAKLRVEMRGEIRRLQESLGITAIYVTHDQEEAMALSDLMVVMSRGDIEQVGNPLEIYQRPRTPFVAEFIGQTNALEGEVLGIYGNLVEVSVLGAKLRAPSSKQWRPGEKVQVLCRPEAITLTSVSAGFLSGQIREATFLGPLARYRVELADGNLITVDHSNPRVIRQRGSRVGVALDPEAITLRPLSNDVC
jgi:ABC-type Fe3+/spermidine/putrescine transport system ATPase subunit